MRKDTKTGQCLLSLYCAKVTRVFVRLFGGVGDEHLFLRDFKEHIRRSFTRDWFSQSSRLEMYHCFKRAIGRDEYLNFNNVNVYRTLLARFRLRASPFNSHNFCYSPTFLSHPSHSPFLSSLSPPSLFPSPSFLSLIPVSYTHLTLPTSDGV